MNDANEPAGAAPGLEALQALRAAADADAPGARVDFARLLLQLQAGIDARVREAAAFGLELTTFHRKLNEAARTWLDGRLVAAGLPSAVREAAVASWWLGEYRQHPEGKVQPCHAVRLYVQAGVQAVGGPAALNAFMGEKTRCSHCAQRYHIENIGLCVLCDRAWCYECIDHRWEFRRCTCGGEVLH